MTHLERRHAVACSVLALLVLAAASGATAADMSGTWIGLCGDRQITLSLEQQGAQVTGTISIGSDVYDVFDGFADDAALELRAARSRDFRGIMPFFCSARFSLTEETGQLAGRVKLRTLLGIRTFAGGISLQKAEHMADFSLILSHVENPSNIYLFFSVQDGSGNPISGLGVDDFELLEDDQPVSQLESDLSILPNPWLYTMSTVLLLDISGSILDNDTLIPLKASAKDFLGRIAGPQGQEMAVYLFDGNDKIRLWQDFTQDTAVLTDAINAITQANIINNDTPYDKSTNLNGAVLQSLAELDLRRAAIPIGALFSGTMVVLTDGTDRANRVTDATAVAAVAGSRHYAFTLGLGKEIDEEHLRGLGKSGFAWADNIGGIQKAFTEIADTILSESGKRYILGYCSPFREGVHKLTLRVNGRHGALSYAFSADGFTANCDPAALPVHMETGNGDECPFAVQTVRRPLLGTRNVPIAITSDMVRFTENTRVVIDGLEVLATDYRSAGRLTVRVRLSPLASRGPYDVTVITEQEKMTCLSALNLK